MASALALVNGWYVEDEDEDASRRTGSCRSPPYFLRCRPHSAPGRTGSGSRTRGGGDVQLRQPLRGDGGDARDDGGRHGDDGGGSSGMQRQRQRRQPQRRWRLPWRPSMPSSSNPQTAEATWCCWALIREAFFSCVRAEVTLQLVGTREPLSAEQPLALEWPLAGVPPEVRLQVARLPVDLLAAGDVANVLPLTLLVRAHHRRQPRQLVDAVRTGAAGATALRLRLMRVLLQLQTDAAVLDAAATTAAAAVVTSGLAVFEPLPPPRPTPVPHLVPTTTPRPFSGKPLARAVRKGALARRIIVIRSLIASRCILNAAREQASLLTRRMLPHVG
uniref:Uncharacterized protein n=1 Tax=Anopheles atroparvus TaxID=41427 RepID=A0A182JIU3_ANOAO